MGMAMPRRYGGLNFPITPYIMAADIVSRADTGFENLWAFRIAPRPSMNSLTKLRKKNSSPAYARERPCQWTLQNRMLDLTFRV